MRQEFPPLRRLDISAVGGAPQRVQPPQHVVLELPVVVLKRVFPPGGFFRERPRFVRRHDETARLEIVDLGVLIG